MLAIYVVNVASCKHQQLFVFSLENKEPCLNYGISKRRPTFPSRASFIADRKKKIIKYLSNVDLHSASLLSAVVDPRLFSLFDATSTRGDRLMFCV